MYSLKHSKGERLDYYNILKNEILSILINSLNFGNQKYFVWACMPDNSILACLLYAHLFLSMASLVSDTPMIQFSNYFKNMS